MNPNHVLRRALCALAISSAVSVCALAHEYEETRIDVRTQAGGVETVLVGALAVGESKTIATIAGNPARVTRTGDGLELVLAGEGFDIPMPDASKPVIDPADMPPGPKVMMFESHVEHASADGAQRKVIVRRGPGEASGVDMSDPGPLAAGQRVRVIRQIHKDVAP